MRRRPAAPGHRPRAGVRFAAGRCRAHGCHLPYVLDRQAAPWARARTCSAACAKRVANRGRHSGNCRHCEMVEGYHLARDADIRRIDVAGRDEDARPVTFGEWLRWYWYDRDVEPDVA